jgi:hypothetical protein
MELKGVIACRIIALMHAQESVSQFEEIEGGPRGGSFFLERDGNR